MDGATGKRVQHNKGGFKTKGAAQKHLNAVLAKVDQGTWRPDKPFSVRELLVDQWLAAQRARELRPTTIAGYENAINQWILPHIGGVRVAALTPGIVVDLMSTLRSEKTANGRQGLSARSVQLAVGVLKSACAWAVTAELISRNPIAGVRRPRAAAPVMRVWTETEARAFLEATKEDRLGFAWSIYLARGLRRGELCGLKWSAVDLDAGTLRIEETRTTVKGEAVPSLPKTAAGRRSIQIDDRLVALLRAHRRRQAAEKLAAGGAYEDRGFLLADELGHPYHPDTISGWFDAKVAEVGLPRIRLHDCRHTAASLMLAAGEPVKVVSEILGHASITITLQTYAHVMPGMAEEAGARLSASLLG
ncbi:MAG: tyrosine-type recombinase/integrase [Thermoleophilia bacterium]